MPEAARQQTNDGAIAFATFVVDQINKAFMNPVAGSVVRLCAPQAVTCHDLEQQFAELRVRRVHADRAPYVTTKSWVGVPEEVGGTSVVMQMEVPALNYVDAQGVILERSEAGYRVTVFNLIWGSDGWLVSQAKAKNV